MIDYEKIYDTLCGNLLDEYAVAGIENVFAEGSFCDCRYGRMRSAYERLCGRLGVRDEDSDLEIIVDSLLDIQSYIARKMFFLGVQYREE